MAKSKLVNTNQKIAKVVVDGYKKIEETVVESYKNIEISVVSGYNQIVNKFVDQYLTRKLYSNDIKMRTKFETP